VPCIQGKKQDPAAHKAAAVQSSATEQLKAGSMPIFLARVAVLVKNFDSSYSAKTILAVECR
jgi:hypothetical protein